MSRPLIELRAGSSTLTVGDVPRVVGTLSAMPGKLPHSNRDIASDIVEIRLDHMPEESDWLEKCQVIETAGVPVLLTIRHANEGGNWNKPERERFALLEQALENLSAVDVELGSEIAADIAKVGKRRGKVCVLSFHDFEKTPPLEKLESIVKEAQAIGSVAKVSTMAKGTADIETLRALLAKEWEVPLCVIAMGASWAETRVTFPTLGSCMTYGYLDTSAAPGQLHAEELVKRLRALMPEFDKDYLARKRAVFK